MQDLVVVGYWDIQVGLLDLSLDDLSSKICDVCIQRLVTRC